MTSLNKSAPTPASPRKLGIVGGLGSLAGGDLFYKLVKSRAVMENQARFHFLFEQQPFKDVLLPLDAKASMTSRKFYVFQVCKSFEESRVDAIVLPCFASHTFLAEVQEELSLPIIDMMDALVQSIEHVLKPGGKVGVIASDFVRNSGLFESRLGGQYEVVYPSDEAQVELMTSMYGTAGIKDGHLDGVALEGVYRACLSLQEQGVSLIAPGMTELSLVAQDLQRRGLPVLDINEIYASFATAEPGSSPTPAFKLGIVGGVGPAATVDFMGKVVAATPAGRDQDHIKMVVEQNPQIPDRTANLLREETDPTMAMYSTCKRLESAGAHAIAIPCNTAHAFVDRIQPHLRIPIVNMLMETARWISLRYGRNKVLGLLATSGTVQSRVYHDAAHQAGLTIITPGVEYQSMVMESIYGERGVKAGHTQGICRTQLLVAAEHLVELGAEVLILGCTELPLIEAHNEAFEVGGRTVALIDPTTILAQRCVALSSERPADLVESEL
ncbi:aspartate/glutamate racemase family protein [Pseudomonas alloputida]|uniref:aspartate/glutamate racemase family protein n=1 Tax=Pseudomonas alloputida TaxID=1940621 RepID=UPI001E39022D|nr:aspartate/glutamate racemase family protein [Pseudomonas alloputida]WJR20081.1 aspartate/glutamate racemase family protein [Pseudomonas alloputida]